MRGAQMTEFRFHPEAEIHLNEIWDFIAEDSIDAADRGRDHICAAIQAPGRFLQLAHP